jgi:hypothetical protein
MKFLSFTSQSKHVILIAVLAIFLFSNCKKSAPGPVANTDTSLYFTVNGINNGTFKYTGLNLKPVIKFTFTEAINTSTAASALSLTDVTGATFSVTATFQDADKTMLLSPQSDFKSFTTYTLAINSNLKSAGGGKLINPTNLTLISGLDNSDKFTRITDDELLTLVQRQTFKYFWDFGHPNSGLARERNTSGDIVTTGGSGFGVMAIVTGIHRGFITRNEGLTRMQKIVDFLKTKATRYHGAYAHWLNGVTGATIPFSTKDDGADIVETSYLMQGLITARQYFSGTDAAETTLRNDINAIYNGVEWAWFRKDNGNVLYWHWSPNYNWDMNLPLQGWNEALNVYIMAAASTTSTIPKSVYDQGWARNGAIKNGNTYYGVVLPLGNPYGGPLFLAHYTFLGVNPLGLVDTYANYETQNKAHTLINYNYCVANPLKNVGYSADCWGLTASDLPVGYGASSPSNDKGVIAPTAALSSFPYTPTESMQALKFFYYKLGDKIFKEYGFVDAFNLNEPWFATSSLAIDQGPIIIMIENHRSKLLWNLFMSAPEIKNGMRNLGFSGPNL